MMISLKIDVTKINKSRLFKGKNGTYLDLVLIESTNDQYGNDFMVVENMKKEEREAGKKGTILGNGKFIGPRPSEGTSTAAQQPAPGSDGFDDLPF